MKNVKIKIKALHSKINFTYDVSNLLDLSSFKTEYKFKIINSFNKKNSKFNLDFDFIDTLKFDFINYHRFFRRCWFISNA